LAGRMDVGHLDKKDYSLYYLSIDSDSPRSLSLKSGSSRAYSGQKLNRKRVKANQKMENHPVQYGSSHTFYNNQNDTTKFTQSKSTFNNNYVKEYTENKQPPNQNNQNTLNKEDNDSYNSHLAFIRMIFHLLDYDKQGVLSKDNFQKSLGLDPKILEELGFESEQEFLDGLLSFQTSDQSQITEEEFVGYLLSRSPYGEEFLQNYVNKNNQWDNLSQEGTKTLIQSNTNLNSLNNLNSNTAKTRFSQINNQNIPEDEVNYNFTGQNFNMSENNLNNLVSYNTNQNFNSSTTKSKFPLSNPSDSKWSSKLNKYNVSRSAQYMMNLKRTIVNEKLILSYNDYKEFIGGYQPRNNLNVTIPKPPSFYDKKGKKERKIKEILEERKREEDEILGYKFKPNDLKREIFISQFENIIVAEKYKRNARCEKLKQKIVQEMKPFSFYEVDEKKYKDKLLKECHPPQFLPFKANPIPWTSQVNLYEDMLTKKAVERNERVEERARQNLLSAKLPPRMEMHDKKKKLQQEELETMDKASKMTRSKSFRANKVPNFANAYETFMNEMEKKKSIAKRTETKPFSFHEPKKKAALRDYLDSENDPQVKNPQFKKNIEDIIMKIKQKPKIEPASTKSLDLFMATRRKELEEKQRKEEKRKETDIQRVKDQNKLKERVTKSRALVDNKKELDDKRKKKQEDFRKSLKEDKKLYQEELERRKQKIYNKPLMFEQGSGTLNKLKAARNAKEAIHEDIEEGDQEIGENIENY